MRLLVPIVLRSLGVALLLAAVLLPLGDHHAFDRMGDLASGQPEDPHWLLIHHHGKAAAEADPTAPLAIRLAAASGVTALLPGTPALDRSVGAAPSAVVAALLALAVLAGWPFRTRETGPPAGAHRTVPAPPPRFLRAAA